PSLAERYIYPAGGRYSPGSSISTHNSLTECTMSNKIWLITRREYLTRIRNKTFLISTFLLPLAIILSITVFVWISLQGKSRHRIAVIDANGYFKDYLKSDSSISFDFSPGLDTVNYGEKGNTAVLIIPVLPEGQKTTYRL